MKSALAFASAAATTQAANLQQSGYVIDLCPSEPVTAPMTMPSNAQILDMTNVGGYVATDAGFATYDQGYGSHQTESEFELLGRIQELNKMKKMYKAQELLSQGVAAYELEQMVGAWQAEKAQADFELMDLDKIASIKKIGNIQKLAAIANMIDEREFVGMQQRELVGMDRAQFVQPAREFIQAAAYYNAPVGMIERETLLPGTADLIQSKFATLPGAYRDDTYITAGNSYVPDSYTPGNYSFDPNCMGQSVTVYPERQSEVLWCGERNLQGNQTLKRTNIHHNYVHDINHKHNYHNRTRHAAKQFNTVEKDCSCKGVAVEGKYQCPPGIEAAAARSVGASFIERPIGAALVGSQYGVKSAYGVQTGLNSLKECSCACN